VQTLYSRLRAAAQQVCADDGTRDMVRRLAMRRCVDVALASAVGRLHNERLAALHGQRYGRAQPVRTSAQSSTPGA
jgi:hypothetical protein